MRSHATRCIGWTLDFMVFGNGYLERRKSRLRTTMGLQPALAKYMRRGADDMDVYFQVTGWKAEHEFAKGSIFHLMEPDTHQEVYGVPEYLSALQSAWLNEAGTLFRRKYYLNGSHAGYTLYVTDALADEDQVNGIRDALKNSKGQGNFRNLFIYAPNGKKDGLQLMPISEVAAKDEFFSIKNVTRDDVLAAHRVPPQLLGLVPTGTTGFGSVVPAAQVFAINELLPLMARFRQVNDWLGEEMASFSDYAVTSAS
ncbi:phage portal protein [Dyella sp. LX-66]|uniref:phage portal protein n=1 Tax=unclassified Dyella TaxID=2634549 RepID=UPI001BE00268|nr:MULTISPECIES: phage portal protein [unclassified Dyella]MBT2119564.1 phage portal protein [Dyella sp. LX-1]MBT2141720.1 phage portal protein [Dyella sp. LX-66]